MGFCPGKERDAHPRADTGSRPPPPGAAASASAATASRQHHARIARREGAQKRNMMARMVTTRAVWATRITIIVRFVIPWRLLPKVADCLGAEPPKAIGGNPESGQGFA
jgi:hypothetical protein